MQGPEPIGVIKWTIRKAGRSKVEFDDPAGPAGGGWDSEAG